MAFNVCGKQNCIRTFLKINLLQRFEIISRPQKFRLKRVQGRSVKRSVREQTNKQRTYQDNKNICCKIKIVELSWNFNKGFAKSFLRIPSHPSHLVKMFVLQLLDSYLAAKVLNFFPRIDFYCRYCRKTNRRHTSLRPAHSIGESRFRFAGNDRLRRLRTNDPAQSSNLLLLRPRVGDHERTRSGFFARKTPSMIGSWISKTCLYKNRIALKATFCVEAATFLSTAKCVR